MAESTYDLAVDTNRLLIQDAYEMIHSKEPIFEESIGKDGEVILTDTGRTKSALSIIEKKYVLDIIKAQGIKAEPAHLNMLAVMQEKLDALKPLPLIEND